MNGRIYTVDGLKKELIQSKIWRTPITLCGTLRRINERWWIYGNYNSKIIISKKWDAEAILYEDGDVIKLKGYLNYKGQRHDGDVDSIIDDIDFSESKLILSFYPIDSEKMEEEVPEPAPVTQEVKVRLIKYSFLFLCAVFGIIMLAILIYLIK